MKKVQEQVVGPDFPATYFDLIKMVGDDGSYQLRYLLMFASTWGLVGIMIFSTSFIFEKRTFRCEENGFGKGGCEDKKYCEMDPNNIEKYLYPSSVYSLAQEFGPFFCEKAHIFNYLRASFFVGTLSGTPFLLCSDGLGRRKTVMICFPFVVIGNILLVGALNIEMACIGLFLSGIGHVACTGVGSIGMGEIVQYEQRQRYWILIQIANKSMLLLTGIVFWLIPHWRYAMLFLALIPCIILWLALIFFLQETPKYLLRQSPEYAAQRLSKIGEINLGQPNLITVEHTNQVLRKQIEKGIETKRIGTPLDLFMYPSIRWLALGIMVLAFTKSFLSFGPYAVITEIGSSIFVNQIVFGATEFIPSIFAYLIVTRIPRRLTVQICLLVSFAGFLGSFFIQRDPECLFCSQNIWQLLLLTIVRVATGFYFPLSVVYITEMFPLSVRAIAYTGSAVSSTLARVISYPLLFEMISLGVSPLLIFAGVAIFTFATSFMLKQTLNLPLDDQIQEIRNQKIMQANPGQKLIAGYKGKLT